MDNAPRLCEKQVVTFFKVFKRYLPHADVFVTSVADPFNTDNVILVAECMKCGGRSVKTLSTKDLASVVLKFPLSFLPALLQRLSR